MKRNILIDIICCLLIFLFAYAAVSKLLDVQKFRILIGQSPMLTHIAPFVAWFIPLSELALCVLLAIGKYRLIGLFGSFAMMLAFTAYIVSILQFSGHIPCSCGGVLQSFGWKEHLVFNSIFVCLSAVGIVLTRVEDKRSRQVVSD